LADKLLFPAVLAVTALCLFGRHASAGDALERRFDTQVQPFLTAYCYSCHGAKKPKAMLDLSKDATMA
jgi:hypothetical protein